MNENQKYGIIGVGLLLGGLFPSGLQVFLFKFLERFLLRIDFNVYALSAIAAYSSTIITVLIFIKMLDYFVAFDFSNKKGIMKALGVGLVFYISLQLLFMALPFVNNLFDPESNIQLWQKYEEPYSMLIFELLVPSLSSVLCFVAIGIIVIRKVKLLPTTHISNSFNS